MSQYLHGKLAIKRLRKANVNTKAGKNCCSSSKVVKQEEFSFTKGRVSSFALFRSLAGQLRPMYIGENNLLYSVYLFKCHSHPEIPSQTHPE